MDTVAQRDALLRELAGLNEQTEIAERSAVDPAVVTAAIEQAERDRDAVTSPHWPRTELRARSKSSNRIDPRGDLGELRWIAFYASDFHVHG